MGAGVLGGRERGYIWEMGAFGGGRGQQKCVCFEEGLLNIEGPRFDRGSYRQLEAATCRQLPEVSQAPQLGPTHPHAPGAKMT